MNSFFGPLVLTKKIRGHQYSTYAITQRPHFLMIKKIHSENKQKKSPSQLIEERVAPKIIEKYCDETKKKECLIKREKRKTSTTKYHFNLAKRKKY